MEEDLIKVLWVEDDPTVTQRYPIEAARYGIELVPFGCWEDAEKALEAEFVRWSAIVLDARCKYKRDSHENAAVFLTQAMHAIDTICAKHHCIIPWYVLSGGSEEELNDLIIDSREEWDGDWKHKKFYSKATDREMLFHRIPYHARISPEMQIRRVYYPDVFKAIRESELGDDAEAYMEDLLLPIHSRNYTEGKAYNDNMTKVRKCIELIFQSMAQHGILPNKKSGEKYVMHDVITNGKGGVNTSWCSLILSGKSILKDEKELVISKENILPEVLKESFKRLFDITSSYAHADPVNNVQTTDPKANGRNTSEFLKSIGNAPYLLRAMAMELCTIILWYNAYLKEHGDEELNALKWEITDNK